MIIEIKVPSPGESITEVEIGSWLVEDGAVVAKDQEIAEVESDKATLTIVAEEGGKISLKAEEGDAVPVGHVVCTIDTSVVAPEAKKRKSQKLKLRKKKLKKRSLKQKRKLNQKRLFYLRKSSRTLKLLL